MANPSVRKPDRHTSTVKHITDGLLMPRAAFRPTRQKRSRAVDLSIASAVFGAVAVGFWIIGDAKAAAWCAAPGAVAALLAIWTTEKT